MFQFPSNGKGYGKCMNSNRSEHLGDSFNSLQTGKGMASNLSEIKDLEQRSRFQFPSNGKVYGKQGQPSVFFWREEFQFPSNGKGDRKLSMPAVQRVKLYYLFQFPSNGKGDRKLRISYIHRPERRLGVSIPFKRERGSQAIPGSTVFTDEGVSIPFKRESGSQAENIRGEWASTRFLFQFPSNGKGDRKRLTMMIT